MSPSVYLAASLLVLLAGTSGGKPRFEPQGSQPAAQTEGEAFERARRSVFVVETESGHGSGFLVDARGLVLTNHHVVGRTPYLAVGVAPDRKYPAVVVARDASRDLALVRVHPRAVEGLEPLRFSDAPEAVKVGARVLAIGSALSKDGSVLTTGIVSRLEADTLLADLNVNPGSSGGPLLNLNGEVLGICTFYRKAPAGPGLAGIVREHVARPIVAMAATLTGDPPSFESLPVASPTPYPADPLRKKAAAIRSSAGYGVTVRGMRVDVLTPPLVYFEGHEVELREARKNSEPDGNSYAWRAFTGQVEAIIGIRAVPQVMEIGGFAQFTSNVREMHLLRNGVDVVPIVPGRFCAKASDAGQLHPAGCFGLYQYPPSAFAPGAELELRVYSDDAPTKPRVWKIPPVVISRVWADFEPWLAFVQPKPR